MSNKPVELSNSETKSYMFSATHFLRLIIAQVDTSSEEEERMDLKQRKGLKGLLADRNKWSTSKEVPKTQVLTNLPPPLPPPFIDLGLLTIPNLKKKRPMQDLEEGEVAPQKGSKQQRTTKNPKDKRATFVESRDEAKVR